MSIDESNTTSLFEIKDYKFHALKKGDIIGSDIVISYNKSQTLNPLRIIIRIAISVKTDKLMPVLQITGQGVVIIKNRTENIDNNDLLMLIKDTIIATINELYKYLDDASMDQFQVDFPSDEVIYQYISKGNTNNMN